MPNVTLRLYTLFRTATGLEEIKQEVPPGTTIYQVLCSAAQRVGPAFRDLIWDKDTGRILPFLIGVKGRIEPSTGGILNEVVEDGAVIILMDPVGGGLERPLKGLLNKIHRSGMSD
ncbi:hypothetical protein KEJ35_04100 [Candidatus Bathyarchaeota archaeon]|nr:hypothetical protein [Candidatus Bathyarchaeota archaeon]